MTQQNSSRHVVYFFDAGFESCSLISLHSVLARTPGPLKITLHPTFDSATLETDAEKLRARFPHAEITVHPIDINQFSHIPSGPLPLTARVRLLLPRLHSGRLLYIDGDTLARKDISPLLDMDLGGACVSGSVVARVALNLALARGTGKKAKKAREKLRAQAGALDGIDMQRYFNSGIMIFDLDRIAELGLDARMMDLDETRKYANRDQTFLNALFNDHVAMFDPAWNSGWGEPRTANSYVPKELRDYFRTAREDPGILHYKGREKPWDAETTPFRLHLLMQGRKRRSRARYWDEFQTERRATEAVLGRSL